MMMADQICQSFFGHHVFPKIAVAQWQRYMYSNAGCISETVRKPLQQITFGVDREPSHTG